MQKGLEKNSSNKERQVDKRNYWEIDVLAVKDMLEANLEFSIL